MVLAHFLRTVADLWNPPVVLVGCVWGWAVAKKACHQPAMPPRKRALVIGGARVQEPVGGLQGDGGRSIGRLSFFHHLSMTCCEFDFFSMGSGWASSFSHSFGFNVKVKGCKPQFYQGFQGLFPSSATAPRLLMPSSTLPRPLKHQHLHALAESLEKLQWTEQWLSWNSEL